MADYEQYHGLVVRELAVELPDGIHIKAHDIHGIVNCFIVNEVIGLFIKHSSKRLSPWVFSFTKDNLTEIQLLSEDTEKTYICLVCGYDGFLTLSLNEFNQIASRKKGDTSLNLHVKRRKRQMYIVGGREKLERSKSRGFSNDMLQAIAK
ncbi:MAG: hypothetical protein OXC42_03045 [Gammaproteobacteria bacterium]|nr:hypothetical protein [Gammaproteobacteria bacterium]